MFEPTRPADPAELPRVVRLEPGKVRERYAVGDDAILLVASDRISAFDVVLPTPIPDKGRVLTGLTDHWLDELADLLPTHRITCDVAAMPAGLAAFADELEGRAMLCRQAAPLPVECVARGYLAGSGWADYRATGTIGGVPLPPGLVEAAELPEAVFTPSTKARDEGAHDENIDHAAVAGLVGGDLAERLETLTLQVYERLAERARAAGLILADTKLEFGLIDGELVLIDEVGTPDSSRLWPEAEWEPGRPPPSFDKQPLRDWLTSSGWDRRPPGPELPDEVVAATRERYVAAYERLTGRPFSAWAAPGP
ncbi:phosphoribosylaminoimidazolesuccinocarboxamide synthase [Egibacter rhizosphaerae]|uniref:Phosphoribosylaminoimidazole-succinocarboxamide synthase n=1 Tax=Egibacter rhizosphaerae TaxID=1670831 RepID=A0A411YG31_9ACTN|nr:phosphoribosylaminoimidazolesuccinocarboxamide synthase [Egibacter rhizosphaerae]QBI20178.1 phosphoribosylaminoimidazolesuccinocarboxamide synthase [Egibacter rhizosphaerae]